VPTPRPPPPRSAPGGHKKLIAGIVAGLAVLVGGAVAAVLLLNGGNDDAAGGAARSSTSSRSPTTESAAVPTGAPGAAVAVGDLQVAVTGTETVTNLSGMTPVNGEFYIVHLTVRNQGSAGAAVHLENGSMPSIPPGDQIRTAIAFDIPPNVDPTAFEFDNDLLDGGGVQVPLR